MDAVQLASRREVAIRPIRPDDGARLQTAYERLSPESKYRRFLAPKPYLTDADAEYLVRVDGSDHVAFVATGPEDPDSILGVARFVRLPEDPRTAEFAVVVGDDFQREGLATLLLERLAQAAADRGIERFKATMLADNEAAHRLVSSLAGRVASHRRHGPIDEVEIELAREGVALR
jgi:RimJ/RimL family protein N-acetyltransferase